MVSGARGHLGVGKLAVMVGGDADAFARAKPIMQTYGSLVLHLGPQGAGLDAKLALNLLRYLCMVASQEASLLAERTGVGAAMAQLVTHAEANRYVGDLKRLEQIPLANRQEGGGDVEEGSSGRPLPGAGTGPGAVQRRAGRRPHAPSLGGGIGAEMSIEASSRDRSCCWS